MLHKSRGIILRSTPYSESSLVVHIYTEEFGMQSYLLQGVRKNKSKIRTSMLQPLHLLQLVVYHKEHGGLQRISELKNDPLFSHIPFDMVKGSLSMFICELLYSTLKEHQQDKELFDFLHHSIQLLDLTEKSVANFHLWFMIRYSKYLGFYPVNDPASGESYFDLKEGKFTTSIPIHPIFMDTESTHVMSKLLSSTWDEIQSLKISASIRKKILQDLLAYYQWHIDGFKGLKSHHVLEEVLGD